MAKNLENKEVITGSDFKRMINGAYSEFLLEYEQINALSGAGHLPGTHILRTMGAAVLSIAEAKDGGIGSLSRRMATAALFGARGSTGVVLAEMFYGIAKGLQGKYDATSSEFGKAFQYGILLAQRAIPEGVERPIIKLAKAVAKGAHHAVRENQPILDILNAAIEAGATELKYADREDAGARILFIFFAGCQKGLDGNFVSPAMSLRLGLESGQAGLMDPLTDRVRPYCVRLYLHGANIDVKALHEELKDFSSFVILVPSGRGLRVHIHTDAPGDVISRIVGWGAMHDVFITNMSEAHTLPAHGALQKVAVAAVADSKAQARELESRGVSVIIPGSEEACPSLAEIVTAAHSDLAETYVLVYWSRDFRLVFELAKRLLGKRVEIVPTDDRIEEAEALKAFDPGKTAAENAEVMRAAIEKMK